MKLRKLYIIAFITAVLCCCTMSEVLAATTVDFENMNATMVIQTEEGVTEDDEVLNSRASDNLWSQTVNCSNGQTGFSKTLQPSWSINETGTIRVSINNGGDTTIRLSVNNGYLNHVYDTIDVAPNSTGTITIPESELSVKTSSLKKSTSIVIRAVNADLYSTDAIAFYGTATLFRN